MKMTKDQPMTTSETQPAAPARSRRRFNPADAVLPALIVLLAAGVGIAEPKFLTGSNLANLGSQIAPLLIVSVGQAFAIIGGGLDLSIAAVMSVAGVVGILAVPSLGIVGGVLVMALVGLAVGLVSGAIIAYMRTSPLIVTLGMASVAQAIALILANGVPIYSVPPELTDAIGFGAVYGIPASDLIAAGVLIFAAVILRGTTLGRYIYAIGSNRAAALKSGVNVPFHTMLIYGLSGLTAGIAAIVLTAWVGAAQPTAEPGITLESIAAVVLGGIALTGGSGGMIHVIYGVLILGMLSNAMNMLGISSYFQILAVGIVIIIAVVLDRLRRKES
ncbi:ABC transporter permease [Zavarzinia compransoris]|uniref:ABC transporter permease n=1 Tax=Zavarzinia marina TaxID=2911065 RepID=UPI001F415B18|nr:ABC transporter permease [Zavarzinia marina]MCF4167351.1 ABC transporter permease [Zavarzinia marina]